MLIEATWDADHAVEEKFDAFPVALTSSFQAPRYTPGHRRAQDAARIKIRGTLPTAWCSGVIRAPLHFDLKRWFPRYPRCWKNRWVWMEMPSALSYVAHKLVDNSVPLGILLLPGVRVGAHLDDGSGVHLARRHRHPAYD